MHKNVLAARALPLQHSSRPPRWILGERTLKGTGEEGKGRTRGMEGMGEGKGRGEGGKGKGKKGREKKGEEGEGRGNRFHAFAFRTLGAMILWMDRY